MCLKDMEFSVTAQLVSQDDDVKLILMNAPVNLVITVEHVLTYRKVIDVPVLLVMGVLTVKRRNQTAEMIPVPNGLCVKTNPDTTTIRASADLDILASIVILRLILVQQMAILAPMAHPASLYNKADLNANVYQDGKDNFVKRTLMIV